MVDTIEEDVRALERHKATCSWIGGYGSIPEIIRAIGAKSVLEIGVAYGYHAHHLLDNCDVKYVGVDPYPSLYDPTDQFVVDVTRMFDLDPTVPKQRSEASDRLYRAVSESLRLRNCDAELHRSTFIEFSKKFPGRKFDLIYIDGDHREDLVMIDTIIALLHVSERGLICGDDIERESVRAAVTRMCGYLGRDGQIHTNKVNQKMTWILR